jgi:hypothetical protein
MYYKRAKLGRTVRITHDIDMALAGTVGKIVEMRGYNRAEDGVIVARFVHVWCEKQTLPDGRYSSRKNVSCSTECLDEVLS